MPPTDPEGVEMLVAIFWCLWLLLLYLETTLLIRIGGESECHRLPLVPIDSADLVTPVTILNLVHHMHDYGC